MFIVIDGIDGSGKGIIIETWIKELKKQGKKIFDLREYENYFPEYGKIRWADVILSAEPTFAWIGLALREEIIKKNKRQYSALSAAHAFALDREILYRRILLPAIFDGKLILQERSVSSSIAYQPIQNTLTASQKFLGPLGKKNDKVSLKELLNLPGNRLALENPPHYLVILKLMPETALQRLAERTGKQDNSIFEKTIFFKKLAERYYSAWFRKFWEKRGTKVIYINTGGSIEETQEQAKEFLKMSLHV